MINYRIVARANKSADLYLYDDIGDSWFGGITSKQVIDDLEKLDAKTINVRINSQGGSVFEGLAIYNALTRQPAEILTHVDSLAASIASIIAMAGTKIHMADNAMMMIHDPYSVAFGTATDMRKSADTLDMIRGNLVDIYAKRTGNTVEKVSDQMTAETWFTASEAMNEGYVDVVTEPLKVAASLDVSRFHNVPSHLRMSATAVHPRKQMRAARFSEVMKRYNHGIKP